MASVIVRGLDDAVKDRLVAQAKRHGTSMEAEVCEILIRATRRPSIGVALMQEAQKIGGIDDLPVPSRTDVARAVDLE